MCIHTLRSPQPQHFSNIRAASAVETCTVQHVSVTVMHCALCINCCATCHSTLPGTHSQAQASHGMSNLALAAGSAMKPCAAACDKAAPRINWAIVSFFPFLHSYPPRQTWLTIRNPKHQPQPRQQQNQETFCQLEANKAVHALARNPTICLYKASCTARERLFRLHEQCCRLCAGFKHAACANPQHTAATANATDMHAATAIYQHCIVVKHWTEIRWRYQQGYAETACRNLRRTTHSSRTGRPVRHKRMS